MLPLDLAEGVSACSKSLSCRLIVSFHADPSEIHHGSNIDRAGASQTPRGGPAVACGRSLMSTLSDSRRL